MSMITTKDDTQIYYKDWGTGQPVVFSHGWPLNADAWDEQLVFLADNGYRAIAPIEDILSGFLLLKPEIFLAASAKHRLI